MQRLRRLVGRRGARQEAGVFVVEGGKILGDALRAGVPVETVFLDEATAGEAERGLAAEIRDRGGRVLELQPGVLGRTLDTVTPQPVAAIVARVDVPLSRVVDSLPDLVVVLVEVRDPGNAGTLVRSAAAAGAGAMVFCDGSVDPYNPKTVRASAGALFHLPVVAGVPAGEALAELGVSGYRRYGTSAEHGMDFTRADLAARVALVLGNEAHGTPEDIACHLDATLTIPIDHAVESLNVAMAGSILCFEAARQRRGRTGSVRGAA